MENYKKFYDSVYARDNPPIESHGWIQWKGTRVCMDITCVCGKHSHLDEDFTYFFECACGKKYAVGQNIKLIELTKEEITLHGRPIDFKKDSNIQEEWNE